MRLFRRQKGPIVKRNIVNVREWEEVVERRKQRISWSQHRRQNVLTQRRNIELEERSKRLFFLRRWEVKRKELAEEAR